MAAINRLNQLEQEVHRLGALYANQRNEIEDLKRVANGQFRLIGDQRVKIDAHEERLKIQDLQLKDHRTINIMHRRIIDDLDTRFQEIQQKVEGDERPGHEDIPEEEEQDQLMGPPMNNIENETRARAAPPRLTLRLNRARKMPFRPKNLKGLQQEARQLADQNREFYRQTPAFTAQTQRSLHQRARNVPPTYNVDTLSRE